MTFMYCTFRLKRCGRETVKFEQPQFSRLMSSWHWFDAHISLFISLQAIHYSINSFRQGERESRAGVQTVYVCVWVWVRAFIYDQSHSALAWESPAVAEWENNITVCNWTSSRRTSFLHFMQQQLSTQYKHVKLSWRKHSKELPSIRAIWKPDKVLQQAWSIPTAV